ncbi:MAG: HD domain-containing protein [Alphaproteobacteria bacterium]|nr:HD domain-containing protein [Alphaproteobacteria bacterium]
MQDILEFFGNAERLHYTERTTQMSNGAKESVSGHCWMMSLMATVFAPKLRSPVDMERVLKLCAVHDLAEAKVGDIPLHKIFNDAVAAEQKHCDEKCVMEQFCEMLGESELMALWTEYEERETPEARFVKQLDKLDVDLQVACSKTLHYVGEYDDNVYWRMYFSEKRKDPFKDEPALMQFFNTIQARIESRMKNELGIDPDIFKEELI